MEGIFRPTSLEHRQDAQQIHFVSAEVLGVRREQFQAVGRCDGSEHRERLAILLVDPPSLIAAQHSYDGPLTERQSAELEEMAEHGVNARLRFGDKMSLAAAWKAQRVAQPAGGMTVGSSSIRSDSLTASRSLLMVDGPRRMVLPSRLSRVWDNVLLPQSLPNLEVWRLGCTKSGTAPKVNILVLEDDEELAEFVGKGLAEAGHQVHRSRDGHDAVAILIETRLDVAVVDRMVPGLDGLSVVKRARAAGCQTPILLLTAVAGIEDRVDGLEAGADDYLVKPFAFSELLARRSALARRPPTTIDHDLLVVGDIRMDLRRRTLKRGGRPVELQPREFSLLEQLMRSPDRVVSRTTLLNRVWNFGFDPQTNIVETHMSRLRSKLNQGFDRNAIRTVRGSGYILDDADG